ncbi:MAG TPA: RNA-binding protein [bacterium]|nr:RNA-binding protein [bacterium]HPO10297.1 RNA-binding protein [bacterium]HQO34562.1 RNA-binding protein [bacterium]HQP99150.1 RNA-binding protein [bacterium]
MAKKIYVGNLPFETTDGQLREMFEQYGSVHSAEVITDRDTGRSRGFAFVEMESDDAVAAISALNGTEIGGRTLKVNEAKPQQDRGGGGGGGGRRQRRY